MEGIIKKQFGSEDFGVFEKVEWSGENPKINSNTLNEFLIAYDYRAVVHSTTSSRACSYKDFKAR